MINKASKVLVLAPLALAMLAAVGAARADVKATSIAPVNPTADRAPNTGNTSAPSNWRLDPNAAFNGVAAAFNGTAALTFTTPGGTYACSGSLLPGGQYILTAAHCADDATSMTIEFGLYNNVALQTRTATAFYVHPGWTASGGALDNGSDIAVVKLSAPVTNLNAYYLSTTNDVGKQYIITGYGTSGNGTATGSPNWADGAYGHYGYNTADAESSVLFSAWDAANPGAGTYTDPTYGVTYVSDFDAVTLTAAQQAQYNTIQRMADLTGNGFSSDTGVGLGEALIAGGDSGGGDFVWDATNNVWLLSAVHSWGWQFCGGRVSPTCDYRSGNSSSYGDISGSTAAFSHIAWVESIVGQSVTFPSAIPEPGTYALMFAGLALVGGIARRRKQQA